MSKIFYVSTKNNKTPIVYRKTNWIAPEPTNINLNTYFKKTRNEFKNFNKKLTNLDLTQNLTKLEKQSLSLLMGSQGVVIKKSDKGNSIVIMNKHTYKSKVYDHLNNEKSYEQITTNTTINDEKLHINSFLETILAHQFIDYHTYKFLLPPKIHRNGIFYILPKIHKENIPGRPIVSSIKSLTENISEFLTLCLQPIIPKIRSYIKNTKHFLQKIMKLPKQKHNILLVTIDVQSLYTNIPHKEGIEACLFFTEKYRKFLPKYAPNKTILKTLLLFVLENNYFEFENKIYRQLFGTAMGTKMAPPYANIFLADLEEKYIFQHNSFIQNITIYLRFLDDIFLIWHGDRQQLNNFVTYLNQLHPTIKFTTNYSETSVNFLDTTVYINKRSRYLCTKLYTKPTDKKSLLHFNSYHPLHTKLSIIYSQALRYRTITTNNKILKRQLTQLKNELIFKKYPTTLINTEIHKIKNLTQSQLLFKGTKKNTTNLRKSNKTRIGRNATVSKHINCQKGIRNNNNKMTLPFTVPYSEHFSKIKVILMKHWHVIKHDKQLNSIFPNEPFISYKRHPNLKDKLIRSKFS